MEWVCRSLVIAGGRFLALALQKRQCERPVGRPKPSSKETQLVLGEVWNRLKLH